MGIYVNGNGLVIIRLDTQNVSLEEREGGKEGRKKKRREKGRNMGGKIGRGEEGGKQEVRKGAR